MSCIYDLSVYEMCTTTHITQLTRPPPGPYLTLSGPLQLFLWDLVGIPFDFVINDTASMPRFCSENGAPETGRKNSQLQNAWTKLWEQDRASTLQLCISCLGSVFLGTRWPGPSISHSFSHSSAVASRKFKNLQGTCGTIHIIVTRNTNRTISIKTVVSVNICVGSSGQ